MASARRLSSSTMAIACLFPLLLTACGSSASAPSAGTATAAGTTGTGTTASSSGTGTGLGGGITGSGGSGFHRYNGNSGGSGGTSETATTLTGTAGDVTGDVLAGAGTGVAAGGTDLGSSSSIPAATLGDVVTASGTTVAATGTSLTNDALNTPVGITVLNQSTPDTGAGNVVDANVLTPAVSSTAPVQADVLSSGQVVSASIDNPTSSRIPAVTPAVNGVPSIVSALPGGAPLAGTISNVTEGNATAPLAGVSSTVSSVAAPISGVTAPLNTVTAPLNPLLNVNVGSTTVIGAADTPAEINADVATPNKLVNVNVIQNSGPGGAAFEPVNDLVSKTGLTTGLSSGGLTNLLSK